MADPYSAKPWLKFYDKHVPPTLEYRQKTYLAYFREAMESVPRKVAVYYLGRGLTFQELDSLSNKFSRYMRAKVAPYKIPGVIEFMEELPNSPIGKVLKRELGKKMQVG